MSIYKDNYFKYKINYNNLENQTAGNVFHKPSCDEKKKKEILMIIYNATFDLGGLMQEEEHHDLCFNIYSSIINYLHRSKIILGNAESISKESLKLTSEERNQLDDKLKGVVNDTQRKNIILKEVLDRIIENIDITTASQGAAEEETVPLMFEFDDIHYKPKTLPSGPSGITLLVSPSSKSARELSEKKFTFVEPSPEVYEWQILNKWSTLPNSDSIEKAYINNEQYLDDGNIRWTFLKEGEGFQTNFLDPSSFFNNRIPIKRVRIR